MTGAATIEAPRLILRRRRPADRGPFQAMSRDAAVRRCLAPPLSIDDCRAVVAGQNAALDQQRTCFRAIERRSDGAFIGFSGIGPGPEGAPAPATSGGRGRGPARATSDHGWATRDGWEVAAITVPVNVHSRGLMIRPGMIRDSHGDSDHPAPAPGDPPRRHRTRRITRPAG